jgi:hypothetical protein
MFILISCLLLFVTALTLIILRVVLPNARYTWLVAVGGAILALVSVFLWLTQMPHDLILPAWQPVVLFTSPILFRADGISFPFALGIAALTLSMLLTAVVQPIFTNSFSWVGTLALGGVGILAVTADNPLTLLLVWASLDLIELITQLGSVQGSENNEKVVTSFSTRALGIGLLLWASILSVADGNTFDFESMPPGSGIFLVLAAGLRLGVLPLHLPYSSESTLRRGFGTSLRLVGAASSLVLLGRVPVGSLDSFFTPILMMLAIVAGIYGGWMWLRAPDELNGRPYWIIGLASLSVISALSGNPLGAVAWGTALILVGGALFLASVQHLWLNRMMFIGAWGLSALPFSLTASAWLEKFRSLHTVYHHHASLDDGWIYPSRAPFRRTRLARFPARLDTCRVPGGDRFAHLFSIVIGIDRLGWRVPSRSMAASHLRFIPDLWSGLGGEAFSHLQPGPCSLGHIYSLKFEQYLSRLVDNVPRACKDQPIHHPDARRRRRYHVDTAVPDTVRLIDNARGAIMVAEIVSWIAVGLILASSTTIIISRDWRVSLGALAVQYLAAFWLVTRHLPFAMGTVKLIVGWMVVATLGMTRLGLTNLEKEEQDTFWLRGQWFRVVLMAIVALVTVGSTPRIEVAIPGLGLPVIAGSLLLIGAGIVHLGVTSDPLRVTLGLLTMLAGFEILYAAVESAILVTGLLAVINLGLGVLGSYLLVAGSSPLESEEEL